MKTIYKVIFVVVLAMLTHLLAYVVGHSHGYDEAYDKQQLVINVLQGKINASRTATVAKTASVNAVSAGAVERVERVQEAKIIYRTQYVDRYKESPDASVTCLSVDSVDAINKLLELQEP